MKKTVFPVNYTLVKAPYIHQSATVQHPVGPVLTVFDLQLLQPNTATLPSGVIHTLDHLLTIELDRLLPDLINLAPMSCQTGFYLTVFDEVSSSQIHSVLMSALNHLVLNPTTLKLDATSCRHYRNLAQEAALTYLTDLLDQGISTNPYIKSLK